MKKRFLSLALAGLLGLGCFSACDLFETENDDGQSTGGEVVVGEVLDGEVTEAQWIEAFENLDFSECVIEVTISFEDDGRIRTVKLQAIINRDKIRLYKFETTPGQSKVHGDYYATEVGENLYIYERNGPWQKWVESKDLLMTRWEVEELAVGTELLLQGLQENYVDCTYNNEDTCYLLDKEIFFEENEPGVDCDFQIRFKDNKMFIGIGFIVEDEGETTNTTFNISFEERKIDLPAQTELNAWIDGTMNGVCDECEKEKTTHYYDGSEECLGVEGEYCGACIYKKEPALVVDGKCDDCGTSKNLNYCDGSEDYFGLLGEYCASCAIEHLLAMMP